MISHQMQQATGLQNAVKVLHRGFLNEAPFVVPLLRPRIREVAVHRVRHIRCASMLEKLGRIISEQPNVSKLMPPHSIRSVPEELSRPLDAKEVGIRLNRRLLNKKRPLAGPNFKFKTSSVLLPKQRLRMKRAPLPFRQRLDRQSVRSDIERPSA